jgi:hypothetical protein
MLKKIVLVLVVVIVAILAFATTRPDTFQVQRSAVINAPPEKIVALIDDFHNWSAWSPWEKLDPAMKRTFGGPARGVGSKYGWQGNSQAGAGQMEIKDSSPAHVGIQLDFIKPFKSSSVSEFALQPNGTATNVTWTMHGPMNYISKVMCMFVSMDKMIGGDFEKGLAGLKAAAEKS